MATMINFQKKVRKKGEEVNNNESLVCDICSVICKSGANLRKHRQRTHDDREYSCDTYIDEIYNNEMIKSPS